MVPKKIALITDSCADLSPELIRENSIFVVPLQILCADGPHLDGVDINGPAIYERLRAGELPKTSLPSVESVDKVFRQVIDQGYDGAVAMILSGGLSGSYNLVQMVAEEYERKLAVRVYDSRSASLGLGMMVLQAAQDIRNGMGWEELTQVRIPRLIDNTFAFFSVDTLEYLQKGGRIGKVTATAGMLLQIKPILTFAEDGQLQTAAKVRGTHSVIGKLASFIENCRKDLRRYNLAAVHGGAPAQFENLRQKITEAVPDGEHFWEGQIGGILSVYIGDGVLGAGIQILD